MTGFLVTIPVAGASIVPMTILAAGGVEIIGITRACAIAHMRSPVIAASGLLRALTVFPLICSVILHSIIRALVT